MRAVAAADARVALPPFLPEPPGGRTVVVGAGKAAGAMAAALEENWPGPLAGLVVVPYGHAAPTRRIEVREAAHPVPDAAGEGAARAILERVGRLGPDDLVICLISGGGSALLTLPAPGLSLAAKQEVTAALLASGAPIGAINTVRRHLSAIKGGRLARAAAPARIVTLAISDVPGDDPALVASGPTVADTTRASDAIKVLERYRIAIPQQVRDVLRRPHQPPPGPADAAFAAAGFRFVATPMMALEKAADAARAAGVTPFILSDAVEGEAREVARALAAIARHSARHGAPFRPPAVLLSGGETTVTVRGRGRGGRNSDFALALALALAGAPTVHAIACDTDGIDGLSAAAGAYVGPDTLERASQHGLDARALLDDNDSARFFERLGDAVVTGPTLTNVNDFRAILVLATEES